MPLFGPCGCCHDGPCTGPQIASIKPNILVNGRTSFGTFAAGYYCVQYLSGAWVFRGAGIRYPAANDWTVVHIENRLWYSRGGQSILIPRSTVEPKADPALAQSSYYFARSFQHTGGEIAITNWDDFLPDNHSGEEFGLASPSWGLFTS